MKLKKSLYLKMRLLWTIFKRLGLWSGSARSQLAMWCRVGSEPQTFLWCDANSGICLADLQGIRRPRMEGAAGPT